ncbi:hypothetical protein [Evansella tamaricis]|uniref:Guanylate kinase n=1 Tax=Evansella tamaricis TaxID=2069301 RepID=A0ABS6JG04_9BACI|nr:hypothetical protein [Evansella tamaricis]MBU9712594.1 hypothetical protein [Evansella tamaricis]
MEGQILVVYGTMGSRSEVLINALAMLDTRFSKVTLHRGSDVGSLKDQRPTDFFDISKEEFETMVTDEAFLHFFREEEYSYGITKHVVEQKKLEGTIPVIFSRTIKELEELREKSLGEKIITLLVWEPMETIEKRLLKSYKGNPDKIMSTMGQVKESLVSLADIEIEKSFDLVMEHSRSPVDAGLELLYAVNDEDSIQQEKQKLKMYLGQLHS